MKFFAPNTVTTKYLLQHESKRHVFLKFLLLLAIIVAYTGVLSWQYGFASGGILAVLTWSFFVLCTPMADAGFLLDFPIRLLFQVKMVFSEMLVWCIAVGVNVFMIFHNPEIYEKTPITHLFRSILEQPIPYWLIIVLSTIGTFLSVRIGDELMEVIHYKDATYRNKHGWKLELITTTFIFIFVVFSYAILIEKLGVPVPFLGE